MLWFADRIRRALLTLETLDPAGQADFLRLQAERSGGYWKPANPRDTWDSQRVELRLFEVFAEGANDAEAVRNWARAARATADRVADRQARVDAAAVLIGYPGPADPAELLMACDTVLEHPGLAPPATVARARALRDSIGPVAA